MSGRYSGAHFKRGFINFIFGKALSAISGFLAMVLIVRALTVPEFASYSVLVSLVEVFSAISALGLAHALLRYVPELYAKHYKIALQNFISSSILIRSIVLIISVLVFYTWSKIFAEFIGLQSFLTVFKIYLIVVFLRTSSNFVSVIIDSTLHQGYSQFGYAINSISRLLGVMYLIKFEQAKLYNVVVVEILSEAIGLAVLMVGLIRVIWLTKSESPAPEDDGLWLKNNLSLIRNFAINGYLQHLAGLPFGSNTNRLVGGGLFGSHIMASFGFATTLYEYVKRYLPAQLLVGLIRPVIVARFSTSGDFESIAKTCDRIIHINLILIGSILAILFVGGSEILSLISANKYGIDALLVLIALMFVLALESHRLVLEMLVHTVNKYQILIFTNFLLSLSVIPAFLLFPYLGAVGFPVINGIALLFSNFWVKKQLSKLNYETGKQWFSFLQTSFFVLISVLIGNFLKQFSNNIFIVIFMTECAFVGLTLYTNFSVFKDFISDMTGRSNRV